MLPQLLHLQLYLLLCLPCLLLCQDLLLSSRQCFLPFPVKCLPLHLRLHLRLLSLSHHLSLPFQLTQMRLLQLLLLSFDLLLN